MVRSARIKVLLTIVTVLVSVPVFSQLPPDANRTFRVVGGMLQETTPRQDTLNADMLLPAPVRDSLEAQENYLRREAESIMDYRDDLLTDFFFDPDFTDSLQYRADLLARTADSLKNVIDSDLLLLGQIQAMDLLTGSEPIPADSLLVEELSRRERRKLEREIRLSDSTFTRHNAIFRDSIPLSRMTWISVVAPGFSQLYNSQAWKIPILYGTVGTAMYFGIDQNRKYRQYKQLYDRIYLQYSYSERQGKEYRRRVDPIQRRMVLHNTYRQLLFGTAAASYLYFLGDGVMNYTNVATNVKIATTLSTICPGAGQIYNRSYWRVPFVVGSMATFIYMIDWNNRGYQRFRLAYQLKTEAEASGGTQSYDGDLYWVGTEQIRNYKNNYRRNRDLCIILLGAVYLLNIVDAHVDAHMKDYDISDDLTVTLEPTMLSLNTNRGGVTSTMGMSLKIHF